MNLHGIASRLDPAHEARVRSIWSQLAEGCELTGINKTPIPHISWMIGGGFDFERIELALETFTAVRRPVRIRTTGLGVFTGAEDVVLYLALIMDSSLAGFHREVWAAVGAHVSQPSAYYRPEDWVPHITLAHGDVDPEGLACATRLLAREDLHWTIDIGEVSLIFQDEDEAIERARFQLSG